MVIEVFNILSGYLSQYPILASLLIGIFTGEETILILAFLSSQGVLPLWIVLVFVPIGTFITDVLFFFLGKTKTINKLHKWRYFSNKYKKTDELVGRLTRENHLLILFYTKFIYGTRIISILFLGLKGTSYYRFLKYNFIITFIWALIVIPLGYFTGKGYTFIINIFRSVELGILFVLVIVILFFLVKKWISVKLIKK